MKKILLFLLFVFIFLSIKTVSAQNYGLTFTNQNAYAQVPVDPTLELTGPLTLEAWIYPTAWKTNVYEGCILNKEGLNYQGYMLRCGANGTLNFNIGTGTAWKELNSASGTLVLNTWQHIAGVYDGTVLKIYVNGVQVGSTLAYTGAVATNTAIPLEIGRSNYYPTRNYLGRVDEVRIWNAAVSSCDIYANYKSTITPSHPNYANLVAYYEMDNYNTDTDTDGNFDLVASVGPSGEVFTAPYNLADNSLFIGSAPIGSTSIEAYQSTTAPASLGGTNQHILKIAIEAFADVSLSQMVFQTNGTTSTSDILNARVWYTGSNPNFSPTTQFGTTITAPPGANNNMTFTGTQTVPCGKSYLWLTYDINPNATLTNLVDATFLNATINGATLLPTTSDPVGAREIAATCTHTLRITATVSGGWNGGLVDVNVNGTPVLTGIGSTFTSGSGPVDFTFNAGTADAISVVRTAAGTYPTRMRVQILDGNGTSVLAAIEPTTTGVNAIGYCGGIAYTTAATLVTAYSAQLNGSYANCIPIESGFRYKKTSETIWNFVQDYNNPMAYDLQGLDPATNYHYQAYAIVGVDTLWGTTVSFATTCVPFSIPFAESFNSTTIPLCWTNSSSNPFNFVTSGTSPSATPFFGSGMARFAGYTYQSGQVGYLVTPALDNLTTGMEVRFWFNRQDYNNSYTVGALRVKANSSNNPTNAVLLTTIQRVYNQSPAELTPGWYEYVTIIPADTFTHIIFECTSDWYGNMYLDEVSIDYPATCPRPPATSVTIPTVLNNSATINWLRGGLETEWEVAYKTPAETTWTTETAYDTLHTIYNLTSATTYQVKVRAVCAPGDESLWTLERTFTTLCDPIPTLPVVEDFETTPTGQIPVCFDKLVSGNATVGVSLTSGNYMLNMSSGSTSNNCFLILPPTTDLINTLRVMFKYDGGANHLFKIGYMTDPALASTFVELHNAPLSNSGSWYSYDLLTTNSILGNERIAIQFIMGSGYSGRLDSLTIMQQPPCVEATNITLTNSGLFDATINWIGTGAVYNLEYKETASTNWIQAYNVTPPYNITGLLQNTSYDVIIQNICDGGILSPWTAPYTFSTLCDLITVLPYVEDFETTPLDAIPACFNEIQNGNANIKVINSSWGGKVLEMSYGASATGDCYIILPKIDFPINTLRVGFIYNGGADNHKFGYITDPNNVATFTEIFNVTIPGNSGWNYFDLLTNNTLSGNERIAIKYNPSAGYHNNRYDSLTVMLMPSCLPPFGLTASSITTTDASLSWSPAGTGTPVDYTIQYRSLGETNWTVLNNVTPPYLLQGLNSSTTYQYQIQANCGGSDFSDWSAISTFMTACGSISTLPWSESFDTYGTLTTSYPTCWTKSQMGSNSLYISSTNFSSPGSLYSYVGTSGNYNIAVTPPFDLTIPLNTLKADFKYRVSSNDDTLYIGVMTSPTDASTFELIAKRIPSTTGTYQDMEVYFNNYLGIGQYIAFKTAYASSSSTSYLDNVVVSTIPACPIPSFLTSSNITAYTADFSWVENGSATSWVIEYGPVGFIQGSGTMVNATSMPFTVSGLTPNTTYQFYIQANCGGSYSDYSTPITITTGLIPITLPYVNDFENPTTYADFGFLNGTQSNKWQIGSAAGVNNTVGGTNAMYISNDNGTSWAYTGGTAGNSKVYAYLDIEVPVGVNELLLDFDWIAKGSLYNYEFLRVYLMPLNVPVVAGSNPPTFNSINYDAAGQVGNYVGGIGEHWLSQQTTWQHKQFSINNTQFPTLAGNTWRLYFHWRNDQTTAVQPPATVDNISITISNCPAPNALSTTNITSSSIDLAWTENGTATSWIVEYGPAGFTLGTGTQLTASINPFQVAALTPATTYDFYVKSDCGAGNFSGWTNKVTATTSCVPTTIPFTESFNDASIPNCWSQTYSGALTSNRWSINTGSNAGGTPNQMVCTYQNNIGISRLIAPAIDFTGVTNPVLTFQYMYDDFGAGVTLKIQTSTDLTNWTDQPFILTGGAGDVGPLTATVNLTLGTGVNYIAWVVDGNHYQINYWYIDDVTVTSPTLTCATPSNLVVSAITASTATATWTAGGTETQWEVAYKPTSASTWNTEFVSAPTYNFSILTTATTYDVKVRAICAVGDTSAYTAIVNFTTGTQSCATPTNLTATAINTAGATIAWTAGGSETSWELDYKLASASTWTTVNVNTTPSHILNTLVPSTAYNVRVRAVCGSGLFSSYTSVTNFSTALTPCIVPTGVNIPSAGITDQSAVVMWTAGGTESQWQVEYKLVSSSNWTTMAISTSTAQLIQALQSNSTYEVRVKAICGAGNESPFTTPVQFTTTGAGTFTITATVLGPGTITPSGIVNVTSGDDQTFTFTPENGNIVTQLLVDNQVTPVVDNSYTFIDVLSNHTIEVHFGVGINENQLSNLATLYPNPTNSTIELKINQTQLQVRECQLYDMYGKLIKVINTANEITTIDVSEYASGVYFIRLNTEMGVITKKFVKK